MFDKITSAAEKLASKVGESRRGFLGRLGKIAAGVVGAMLVLPKQARGTGLLQGYCVMIPAVPPRIGPGHPARLTGAAVAPGFPACQRIVWVPNQCPPGAAPRALAYVGCSYSCSTGTCTGLYYDPTRRCTI